MSLLTFRAAIGKQLVSEYNSTYDLRTKRLRLADPAKVALKISASTSRRFCAKNYIDARNALFQFARERSVKRVKGVVPGPNYELREGKRCEANGA